MNISTETINTIIEKYIKVADKIGLRYNYPSNITHLLYLIIPAFVIKYGIQEESAIIHCFEDIPIKISNSNDNTYKAFYLSIPYNKEEGIITRKSICLTDYNQIELISLLDNLIHEINHAVNSYKKEITVTESKILLRTGISRIIYNRKTLQVLDKTKSSIIEEIINTKQTEQIIDIINGWNKISINNEQVKNTLYALYHSVSDNYQSQAYLLQSYICKELMNNKTFFNTLEQLRYNGFVDEIDTWFDTITGKVGSFQELSLLLSKSLDLEINFSKNKRWKRFKIKKIQNINREVIAIIDTFNKNCNYK